MKRILQKQLQDKLSHWPACAMVGPRQCGKTTLARSLVGHYFDIELESERLRLDLSWGALLEQDKPIILDEAQSWPDLFPRLRSAIDADRRRNGRFLLLGSIAPSLMTHVSQSLAGRLALVELTPFLFGELETGEQQARHWLAGGFPDGGILQPDAFPDWQQNFLDLLAQRDLPQWGLTARPQMTMRLLRMLAAVHGQEWNASRLGQSLGLSYHTVNEYLDLLEGAFLVRRLQPWHRNLGKRLVKRPKVYLRDSGLVHSLWNVRDTETLLSNPGAGASWEGHIIDQVLGWLAAEGLTVQPCYLRTSDQYEIDLVLEHGGAPVAIEIKLGTRTDTRDLTRLNKAADWIGAGWRVLLSHNPETVRSGQVLCCNLGTLITELPAILSDR